MRYAILVVLAWAGLGCGGGGGTGSTQSDGSLYVENVNEGLKVWATVVLINGEVPQQDRDLPQGVSPQEEVEIPLNEKKQITAVLPGGSEVQVKLKVSRERTKDFDLTVDIDGSWIIYITDMNPYEEGIAGLKHELRSY